MSSLAAVRRRPGVLDHHRFDPNDWEQRRRAQVDRAFGEVLLYREQWAAAGRVLEEPVPVRAADLDDELYRLCPIARPWSPTREPSLWIGDPGQLRDALTLAGAFPDSDHGGGLGHPGLPVLEVRQALVDWLRLGWLGPTYAAVLGPSAPVTDESRRTALTLPALTQALHHGGAVLIGSADERAAVMADAQRVLGSIALDWHEVDRRSPRQAAESADGDAGSGSLVVHDPFLGYVAARVPTCGRIHVLWTDVHCGPSDEGLVFTRLRTRRPTLVSVLPVEPGFSRVDPCPEHGTPVLSDL